MGEKDQASVGSWIYCDDHHELDFEVGYGNTDVRKKLNASPDDMIAYMTSQDFPYSSVPVNITQLGTLTKKKLMEFSWGSETKFPSTSFAA